MRPDPPRALPETIAQALNILAEQSESKPLRECTSVIAKEIESGATLAEAFRKYPRIFDDLFTIQKKRVMEICEEIIRRGLFVEWSAESRVDTVTFEMLRLMRKAGCIKLYYGLESGSPEQLVAIKKKVTQEGILKGAELTRQIGIYFKFFLIYGFPGETERDHRITESIVTKAMPHNIAVSLLCPHKGTEVYEQIKDLPIPEQIAALVRGAALGHAGEVVAQLCGIVPTFTPEDSLPALDAPERSSALPVRRGVGRNIATRAVGVAASAPQA